MFITRFRAFRLPTAYKEFLGRLRVGSYNSAIEMIAWIQGERVDNSSFIEHINQPLGKALISSFLSTGLKKPEEDGIIDLVSNDKKTIEVSTWYLRRRFQFIDDYLSTFPHLKSINLPFNARVIAEAIFPELNASSPFDIECISYLNPKDPMYYFLRTTVGVPLVRLLEWTSLLSEEQKTGLIEARRLYTALSDLLVPLPNEGRGDAYIACLFEIHEDMENLTSLFSSYPSYLTLQSALVYELGRIHKVKSGRMLLELLLTADYLENDEAQCITDQLRDLLRDCIDSLLVETTSKEVASKLLAIRGRKRILFENTHLEVTTPYSLGLNRWYATRSEDPLVINVAILFNAPIVDVRNALL